MKPDDLNYRHLLYFWAVAKEGSITRAGERLGLSVQAISTQLSQLERQLGQVLLAPQGRSLVLTESGRRVLVYADQIFALGAELEAAVGSPRGEARTLNFRVGIADAVPKAIAYRLLEPALGIDEHVHLICHEGHFRDLLGQLSVHRLDLVIANEPMGRQTSVKAFNHPLGTSGMSFLCAPALRAQLEGPFPQCLHGAPMLIQGPMSSVRQQLDHWLNKHQLQPRLVGEFDDSALMNAFGREGRGIFTSPSVLDEETTAQFGVEVIGRSSDLVEEFFAISVERRITHPCVVAITKAAKADLFAH